MYCPAAPAFAHACLQVMTSVGYYTIAGGIWQREGGIWAVARPHQIDNGRYLLYTAGVLGGAVERWSAPEDLKQSCRVASVRCTVMGR